MTPEKRIDLDFLNKSLDIQSSSQKKVSQAKIISHINEQDTHVIGQSDYIPQKTFAKVGLGEGRRESKVLLEKHAKKESLRGVDSLSLHLMQSLQTNDFEMINVCLSNKVELFNLILMSFIRKLTPFLIQFKHLNYQDYQSF